MSDKDLQYTSCFDVIGPIMIGPSSSHTAGACAIGRAAYKLFEQVPAKARITYYESFADTHKGHGTDYAIISGLLGFEPADERVPEAVEIATEQGMQIEFIESKEPSPAHHANTALIELARSIDDDYTFKLLGASIGGGAYEVRLIMEGGLIIRPNYTKHLIVLKTHHPITKQEVADVLSQMDVSLDNFQPVRLGENEMCLLNTNRDLSHDELVQLKHAVEADEYVTLM